MKFPGHPSRKSKPPCLWQEIVLDQGELKAGPNSIDATSITVERTK